MHLTNRTNAFANHIRNYLIAGTLFATGKAIIRNRDAIVIQFQENGALTLFFNLDPLWVSWMTGVSLIITFLILSALNVYSGIFYLLDMAKIPSTSDATVLQKCVGFSLVVGYLFALASFSQIILVLAIVAQN